MKSGLFIGILGLMVLSCTSNSDASKDQKENLKNEVIVLGTIHGQHLKKEVFSIEVLTKLIQKINPDIILTEIPPDRFPIAMKEFLEKDSISEPRVVRFPEYIDVIFPLSKEMDFKIIPTAGWTKEMAMDRSKKLKAISQDSSRTDDWNKLTAAEQESDSLIKASGLEFDPYWINSDEYDQFVEVELKVYNELFNEELGLGGWDNINKAHYALIAEALEKYKFQNKRILITYGAGHKGWFLRELKKRDDIVLKTLAETTK
jgi:hypothetical protein